MDNAKRYVEAIYNIRIDVIKEADSMDVQELNYIKLAVRNLYENLVQLQYEAEGRKDE